MSSISHRDGRTSSTALQTTASSEKIEIVKTLLKAGANIIASASAVKGRKVVRAASEGGHKETLQLLIESGAEFNAPQSEYEGIPSPVAAFRRDHLETMEFLLNNRADDVYKYISGGNETAQ